MKHTSIGHKHYFDATQAYSRYIAGETFADLARVYGLAKGETVLKRIRKAGFVVVSRRGNGNRLPIDVAQLVKRYTAGASVKQLAEHLGCDRNVITRRLQELGVRTRDRSESMFLRMAQTPAKERRKLAAAAHAAVRGRKRSFYHLCKLAIGKQNIKYASPIERRLIEMFTERGIDVTSQLAVGKYNIDVTFTTAPIAVEVFGGHWHTSGPHAARFRERFDYIINAGWIPVIVWVANSSPLQAGATEYCIALAEKLRRHETVRRQEHVIGGNGQPLAIGATQLPYLP